MVYRFSCPVPCNRVIKVYANTDEDAIDKIMIAGAISCRNRENQRYCEKGSHEMPSLPKEQLREIVRLSMEAESVDGMPVTMSEKTATNLDGALYAAGTV